MGHRPERLMQRNGIFYARICVPKDLNDEFGRKAIVSSLHTRDLKTAKAELARKAGAAESSFAASRAVRLLNPTPEQLARIKADERRRRFSGICRLYAEAVREREYHARAELFEAAMGDPSKFEKGEIIPLPAFEHYSPSERSLVTYFNYLMDSGDLEFAVGFLNRLRLSDRIRDLRRKSVAGNLGSQLATAREYLVDEPRGEQLTLARLLLNAEFEALSDIAHGDPEPFSESVQWEKRNTSSAQDLNTAANTQPTRTAEPGIDLNALFARWEAEADPSASTLSTWRGIVRDLTGFLESKADNIRLITSEDIVGWKDKLVASGKATSTISRGYLGCARTLFRYAVANKLMPSDPSDGIKVARKAKAGTKMLGYSNEEVARLLELAKSAHEPWKRWLPWLAAATGSRIGEVAQLHGSHFYEIEGVSVVRITPAPDAGSIKNAESEREVPLHPALIDAGFLKFVEERGQGPLFYRRSSGDPKRKHASKSISNRLATWIRGNGFKDPRKAPNHALRHWFKSQAARVGIPDSIVDRIQGHADTSASDLYRHIDVHMKKDALSKLILPPQ